MSQLSKKKIRKLNRNAKLQKSADSDEGMTLKDGLDGWKIIQYNKNPQPTGETFLKNAIERLNDDRMGQSSLSDILMQGQQFSPSNIMLEQASKYFAEHVPADVDPTDGWNYIDLTQEEEKYLEPVIHFMYTKEITVTKENLRSLLRIGKKLKMQELLDRCQSFLIENMNNINAMDILIIAQVYLMKELEDQASEMVANNYPLAVRTRKFKNLNFEQLTYVLNLWQEKIVGEDMFRAFMHWISQDEPGRQKHFVSLFAKVDVETVGWLYWTNIIMEQDLVKRHECCHAIGTQAIQEKRRLLGDRELHESNCLEILAAAHFYEMTDLADEALTLVVEHFSSIVKTKEFLILTYEQLARIMKLLDEVLVDKRCNAVVDWVHGSIEIRQKHFAELFLMLNISRMDKKFVRNLVLKEEVVTKKDDDILLETLDPVEKWQTLLEYILCESNCLEVLIFSSSCEMEDLASKASAMVVQHFSTVVETEKFKKLNFEQLRHILDLLEEEVLGEDTYAAVINWVNHNQESRQKHFSELFLMLDISTMDLSFLENVVLEEEMVQSDEDCEAKVAQAMEALPSNIDSLD